MISGQLAPTSGRLVFDGTEITGWPAHRIAQAGLVRTFQLMRPFGSMSVIDNVAVAAHTHERSRPGRARRRSRCSRGSASTTRPGATDRLTTAGLKRLELARALAMRPHVLLLDEVLAGLVPAERATDDRPVAGAARRRPDRALRRAHHGRGDGALARAAGDARGARARVRATRSEVIKDPRVVEAYLGEEPPHERSSCERAGRLRPDGDPPRGLAPRRRRRDRLADRGQRRREDDDAARHRRSGRGSSAGPIGFDGDDADRAIAPTDRARRPGPRRPGP